MDVILTLIPAMIFIGLLLVIVLFWAVRKGMYDDMEGEAHRILMDEVDEGDKPDSGDGERYKAGRGNDPRWPDAD